MGELNIGYNTEDVREYLPEHAGVNWHEAWVNNHEEGEYYSVWGETFDELGEFCEQLNQTNCVFYLNDTDDSFDCLVVVDHRDDGGDFYLPRYQLGDEQFDYLIEHIGHEVTVCYTKYPIETIAKFVMKRMFEDVDKL